MLSSINNNIQNDEKFMEILFKILQKKNNYPNGYNIDNAKDYLNKLTKNLIKEYDGNIGVNIYTDLLGKNIKEIEVSFPNVEKEISSTIEKLEYIYGTDSTNFVCGKYYIESLARYLSSKLSKGKVGYDELERFLVSNFDIESLAYIRDRLYSYISSN